MHINIDKTKWKRKLYNGIPLYILIIASIISLALFIDLAPKETSAEVELDPELFARWDFNEGEGKTIEDKVGTFSESKVSYLFNDAVFQEPKDPSWRNEGVEGGSLLFDGFTTHFKYEDFDWPEGSFTLSTWVAPRAHTGAYADNFASILSSYTEQSGQMQDGIDFGMHRHGAFGVRLVMTKDGVDETIELFDEGHPLDKYAWNHIGIAYDMEDGELSLFKNGEIVNRVFTENEGMTLKDSVSDLYVGKNANSHYEAGNDTNAFMGLMDELEIYEASKDGEDIRKLYQQVLLKHDSAHPEVSTEALMWTDEGFETDRFRPQFHAVPVQSWMNEPHAPFYHEGKYHLFYQFNPFGSYFGQHHWGHWVSDDMVHWEHEKPALSPLLTDNHFAADAIWSGGAAVGSDGRPRLFYTAGPSQTIGMAMPEDLSDPNLADWDMYPDAVLRPDTLPEHWNPAEFRDPHIWKHDDRDEWYMLITAGYHDESYGGQRGASALFSTTNLRDWTFRGPMMEPDSYVHESRFGSSWELTVMLPLRNEEGEHVKDIYMFLPHGGGSRVEVFYYVGEFNDDTYRFEPDHERARKLDYGDGIFTGPSGMVDPETKRSILHTIAQDDRDSGGHFTSGWAHNAGTPISLYYEDGKVHFDPIEEMANARERTLYDLDGPLEITPDSLNTLNDSLESIQTDLLDVEITFENETADELFLKLRKTPDEENVTRVGYDFIEEEAYTDIIDSSNAPKGSRSTGISEGAVKANEDGTITMRILLDRSLLETYVNSEMSITKRIYPDQADALGVELFTDGYVTLHDLTIHEMGNVYGENEPPYYGE